MARKPVSDSPATAAPVASPSPAAPLARAAGVNIVSSSHLVSVRSPELSEFEFGLNTAYNAYSRWVVRCMG
ncbi:MAG TPA: transcriptional regulator, partial [Cupriavidus sp.]|nr:transcriptional regulator [Cupriavidus sp.]